MTRACHPLHGTSLAVLGHTHRRGILHLTLVLPDGTRSLIPASWTDIEERVSDRPAGSADIGLRSSLRNEPPGSLTSLGSVFHLLQARKVVDALLRRLDRVEPSIESASVKESNRATTTGVLDYRGTSSSSIASMGRAGHRATRCSHRSAGQNHRQGGPSPTDPRS